jgi:hypothetical protein
VNDSEAQVPHVQVLSAHDAYVVFRGHAVCDAEAAVHLYLTAG